MTHPQSPFDLEAQRAEYERLLETYGSARARWPAPARNLYDVFDAEPEGARARAAAAVLDSTLAMSRAPRASAALAERLLADFSIAAKPRLFAWRHRALRRFAPAGALAALSAAGFAIGAATAQPTEDALYYADAAIAAPIAEETDYWSGE